jgi:hypothetical protein
MECLESRQGKESAGRRRDYAAWPSRAASSGVSGSTRTLKSLKAVTGTTSRHPASPTTNIPSRIRNVTRNVRSTWPPSCCNHCTPGSPLRFLYVFLTKLLRPRWSNIRTGKSHVFPPRSLGANVGRYVCRGRARMRSRRDLEHHRRRPLAPQQRRQRLDFETVVGPGQHQIRV